MHESFWSILKSLGFSPVGGNVRTLKYRLDFEGINYSHIRQGTDSNRGRMFPGKGRPYKEVLIKKSSYSRHALKNRLIRDKILKNRCKICRSMPIWQGKPLVMRLDHVNGICNDNRLKNLRLVCPNCESQLQTFAGRNKKYKC